MAGSSYCRIQVIKEELELDNGGAVLKMYLMMQYRTSITQVKQSVSSFLEDIGHTYIYCDRETGGVDPCKSGRVVAFVAWFQTGVTVLN